MYSNSQHHLWIDNSDKISVFRATASLEVCVILIFNHTPHSKIRIKHPGVLFIDTGPAEVNYKEYPSET